MIGKRDKGRKKEERRRKRRKKERERKREKKGEKEIRNKVSPKKKKKRVLTLHYGFFRIFLYSLNDFKPLSNINSNPQMSG